MTWRLFLLTLCTSLLSVTGIASAHVPGTLDSPSMLRDFGSLPPVAAGDQVSGYKVGGSRWPGRTITYWNGLKGYDNEVRAAISAWNRSGVRVKFRKVSKSKAKLRIIPVPSKHDDGTSWGTIGYVRYGVLLPWGGTTYGNRVWFSRKAGKMSDEFNGTRILVHELGHVLGLDHSKVNCATMSYLWDRCQEGPQPWQYFCRLLEPDDLRGAIRLYGGQANPTNEFCEHPAPTPIANLAVVPRVDGSGFADVSFLHTPYKDVRNYYRIATTYNGAPCATDPNAPQVDYAEASPSQIRMYFAGPACTTVWTLDPYDRVSAPVSVIFNSTPAASTVGYDTAPDYESYEEPVYEESIEP